MVCAAAPRGEGRRWRAAQTHARGTAEIGKRLRLVGNAGGGALMCDDATNSRTLTASKEQCAKFFFFASSSSSSSVVSVSSNVRSMREEGDEE